ncbi:MipA/OmpV family protein [Chitinimonas sp.]|uniref:MipA/OmpV family protein n=1 Tax=Chitinimonas sp. TaxID=1934313 RepID=UPI0035B15D55
MQNRQRRILAASTTRTTSYRARNIAPGLLLSALLGLFSMAAQAAENQQAPLGWSVTTIAGAARVADFEGSRTSHTAPILGAEASYRTADYGTFGLGRQGLSWAPFDGESFQAGIAISSDAGRDEKKPSGLAGKPGSERLRGLGKVEASPMIGLFAGGDVGGIGASFSIAKATSHHKGLTMQLGASLPIPLREDLTLTPSASINWADSKYMGAYFGVSRQQAARSAYRAFEAKAGVKSVDLGLALAWQLDKHWSINPAVTVSRLQGDAAASPITERRTQTSISAAVAYTF